MMLRLHALMVVAALCGQEAPRRFEEAPAPISEVMDLARLRELLYNRQSPPEQSQAALLLVQSQATEAGDLVRDGLRRWDRPDVFQALAAAIRVKRDRRFAEPLLKALASEQVQIRQASIDALARLDSVTITHRLMGIAEDASVSIAARQAATTALGRSGQKPAVVALLSLLACDSPAVRQTAVSSLEELTGQTFGNNLTQWQAWWQQQKDLSEAEWLMQRTSYYAERSRRLEDELRRAEDNIVRLNQLLYTRIPPADRPSHFRVLAQNEYPAVRGQVVTWIGELLPEATGQEQKQLAELLLLLSDDGVESVQRQAVLMLEKLDDPKAFERLLTLLQSGSVNVRAAAARSLGRYRCAKMSPGAAEINSRALAALEKALADISLQVVAEAVESLGSIGVPEAAPIIVGLLRHPSDAVRQAAGRALEQVGNQGVLSELYGGLDDPVPSVRFSLVGALGKIGAAENLEEAQKTEIRKRLEQVLLRDGDPGVRSRAATVIGDLGTPAELPILWQRVIATEDNRVQLKAWTAMIDILSRSLNWGLITEWDQTLATQKEPARRIELLTELRNRWTKIEAARPMMDTLTGSLIQAQLANRKWNLAVPLALDLAKKPTTEAELQKRLRWLLVAGSQALDDQKPMDVLLMLKELETLLPRASGDLGAEFDSLRQRTMKLSLDRPGT